MPKLDKLFRTAVEYKASDLFITTGSKPMLRINGELLEIAEHPIVTKKTAEDYIFDIMTSEQQQKFTRELDLDLPVEVEGIARFRVNVFTQRYGMGAVFRLIPSRIQSIEELRLPSQLKKIAAYQNGIVIFTGPTSSGKSTSLAAIVHEINLNNSKHIITIEDPIEFIHDNKRSLIDQREVGIHTSSFQRGLRACLREGVDVILLGEMRDLETISLAITAAETGHLVLATLHTSGAANSVDRIIDVFPPEQQNQIRTQLAASLRTVIWQSLIKTKDGKGRAAALEIMFNNTAIAHLIRKGQTHQIGSVIETRRDEGMQTMKKSLEDLVKAGLISEETAFEYMPTDEY